MFFSNTLLITSHLRFVRSLPYVSSHWAMCRELPVYNCRHLYDRIRTGTWVKSTGMGRGRRSVTGWNRGRGQSHGAGRSRRDFCCMRTSIKLPQDHVSSMTRFWMY